ncbi:ATP-binding protein [Neoroseomonas alba]|uniref:ATP-binding protein n=1 Tax=Roseomonas alba TaxID=2846776 RepID=UPI002106C609|nr:adenylate/guanylate cyclase domain-containing protein [Neoroseomonas alba]
MSAAEEPNRCPRCGTPVLAGARFCHGCGQSLTPVPTPRPEERKALSVLFADIRGSTRLIFNEDPERAREYFRPAMDAMVEAVRRYGGTVNRVVGDGIMAMFGAPVAMEQHALGACCAAIHMRDLLRRIGQEQRARHGIDIATRIGVHSGEVVVHDVANDLSAGLDAAGAVVHIAARIEQATEPGEAWISAATLRLVEGYVTVDTPRMLDLRGASEPVEVYRLVTVDPRRPRLEVATRRRRTPFICRTGEMSVLDATLNRSIAGHGAGVVLVGDAGCGKSRLVHEFLARQPHDNPRVMHAFCQRYDATTPLAPLASLARSHFGIEPEDDTARVHDRVEQGLRDATGMADAVPALVATLSHGPEEPFWKALAPDQRQRRLHSAFAGWFRHLADQSPLVLTVEDLHWADGETLAVLDRVADSLPASRQMLLLDHRPEFTHAWPDSISALRVDPLTRDSTLELIRRMLGDAVGNHRLARLLAERTGGNPFFLEECISSLLEQGALVGEVGDYRLVADVDTLDLPDTVRSLIASRIDRLLPADKQVLQAAAIMAREVAPPVLAAMLERPEREVVPALARLAHANLMGGSLEGEEAVFEFRHALIQETTYAGMLKTYRRDRHARLLAVLEGPHGERMTNRVEALALHAARGEAWAKAARYGRQAGAKAAARSANREAVQFFEQAIGALKHLPDAEEVLQDAVDIRFDLRTPMFRLGQVAPLFERLREAERIAQRLGDHHRLGQLAIFMSHQCWLAGDNAGAIGAAERAAAIGRSAGDAALVVRAGFQAGLGQVGLNQFAAAATAMATVAELAEQPGYLDRFGLDRPLAVVALGYRARALSELGEFQRASEAVEACQALAATVKRPFTSIFASIAEGHLRLMTGEPNAAMTSLEAALDFARKAETELMIPVAEGFFGAACTAAGRWRDGVQQLSAAVAHADAMGFLYQQPLRLALLAEAHLAAGEDEAAATQAKAARNLAERQGARGALAHALMIEAQIARRAGDEAMAETTFHRALGMAEELSMRPLAVRIRAMMDRPPH